MENTENEIWKETYLSPDYLVSNLGRTNRFFGEDIVQTTNSNASSENCSGKG